MSDLIQGLPSIMLGPDADNLTDYTCAIRVFQINERRNMVLKPPTPSNPFFEEKAGAGQASVLVEFIAGYVASSGLWQELLNAMNNTDTAELYFEYIPADDTISDTNPKRTGWLVVNDLDMGAPTGQARRQTKTFPARTISAPITV